jgi:hypothetical protein
VECPSRRNALLRAGVTISIPFDQPGHDLDVTSA